MFRLIGYFGGIILFLVLGIKKVPGFRYFFIFAILNLAAMVLIIIFRLLAKYFHGFWRIWSKRLQRWISEALMCLGHHTQLPQYQITTVTINQIGQKTITKQRTNYTFLWGFFQMLICAALTAIAPLVVLFVLFCYVQSIVYQCRYQKEMKEKNEKKQEEIARGSARVSLEAPLNESLQAQKKVVTFRNSLVSTYHIMEPAIVKKSTRISLNKPEISNLATNLQQKQKNIQDFHKQILQKQVIQLKEELQAAHITTKVEIKDEKTYEYEKVQERQEFQIKSVEDSRYKQQKMYTKTESIQIEYLSARQDITRIHNDEL